MPQTGSVAVAGSARPRLMLRGGSCCDMVTPRPPPVLAARSIIRDRATAGAGGGPGPSLLVVVLVVADVLDHLPAGLGAGLTGVGSPLHHRVVGELVALLPAGIAGPGASLADLGLQRP